MDPIVEKSRLMIVEGSRSFAGAARLMDPATRRCVYMLYAWCRYCDDCIDMQDLGQGAPAPATISSKERLETLEIETLRALAGEPVDHPVFIALQRVVQRHSIPDAHPLELLRGFAMDVEGYRYRTLEDTLSYCYHVAGVVGRMMAHIMGVRDRPMLDRASDLGIALQMTNIARDVMDDASAGRVYLPQEWLDEAGVPYEQIGDPRHRVAVSSVTSRFLQEADLYYRSATTGLPSLGFRSAWAIAAARGIYRDIGRIVQQRGSNAWDERAVVGKGRKLYRVAGGCAEAIAAILPLRRHVPREGLWTRPEET